MEKHKSIAIPVTFLDGVPHFLLVHDRRYSEWTFVTGGCKNKEIPDPIQCALRELEEETRGVIDITYGKCSYFTFINTYTDFETNDINSIYHVYIIDFESTINYQKYLENRFREEKHKMDTREISFKKQYDENDFMEFDTLEGLKKRKVWKMIREKIIENPIFYEKLYETHRTLFNINNSDST
jgi:8-oxo-dGTP pyrophosphatase MutT (NUDIX family)